MIILGIDLSLVSTGYVLLRDGKIIDQQLIKSKPVGDKPIDELKRLLKIVDEIDVDNVGLAVIEGIAFGIRKTTSLSQLSVLNYLVRKKCYENNVPFIVVAPATLKKFVTGSGRADKGIMMLEVFKRWNFSSLNSDICDAYALAKVGHYMLNLSITTTKKQKQCLTLLKKQL